MVVVVKRIVVSSTVEGEETETPKVRVCVDLTKLNEIVTGCQLRVLADSPDAVITPFGRSCFRRLPFGIINISAPEHFQKRMQKLLEDLPGVLRTRGDIIFGESSEKHDARVRAVF